MLASRAAKMIMKMLTTVTIVGRRAGAGLGCATRWLYGLLGGVYAGRAEGGGAGIDGGATGRPGALAGACAGCAGRKLGKGADGAGVGRAGWAGAFVLGVMGGGVSSDENRAQRKQDVSLAPMWYPHFGHTRLPGG